MPVALGCIWAGGPWWAGLVALCVAGLAWEWVRLCGGSVTAWPGFLLPLTVLAATAAAVAGLPLLGLLVVMLGAALSGRAAGQVAGPMPPRWFALGAAAIGLGGVALVWLRTDPLAGAANVLFLFLVVWASDIGAYMTGRALGGPRLWPAVSPNKTWAGALGGLAAAMAIGFLAAVSLSLGQVAWAALPVAGVLGMAAQGGDLLESWLKRRFGVKDSSGLIPGHGGLLDRLDGVLAAAPLAALLSAALGAGVPLWNVTWWR